jgi:hypothetical protein
VLAVVFAVGAGLLVWVATDDGGDDAVATDVTTTAPPTTDDPTTTDPSTPGTTDPPSTDPSGTVHMTPTGDDDLDAAIEDAARYVEQERGLLFKEPVLVEALDDDAFVERLRSTFEDEDVDDLEVLGDLLIALGLMDPDTDVVETFRSLLDIGVLGFYDPETKELVVRGSDPTLYTQETIVHELTHALDDQWFDLDRPELDDADDETGFGFSALVEGNARRVEYAWRDELSDEERSDLEAEEMAFALQGQGEINPFDFPLVLVDLIQAPYDLGDPFVQALLDDGGQERLDATFEEPPVTSEQVQQPDKYLDGEGPIAVDPPPADGEVIDQGAIGEYVLELLLDDELPGSEARTASDGWGGDWYVAWHDGDETCLRADFAMDTANDRDELERALGDWADGQDNATVETHDDLVRLTSCN